MTEQKIRGRKTSTEQMSIFVQYLETNKIMITGKCHPLQTKELEDKWDEIVRILNDVPNGARKDKKQWKNFLYEWKSKTKKKAREMKKSLKKTGGGSYTIEELTELENRLMAVLGWVSITGCLELPEELDPDHNYMEGRILPDENIEIIVVEDPTMDLEEYEDPNVNVPDDTPSVTPKKGQTVKPRRAVQSKIKTHLERSAEIYSKSTEDMAVAITKMAAAITKLSEALAEIAVAISSQK